MNSKYKAAVIIQKNIRRHKIIKKYKRKLFLIYLKNNDLIECNNCGNVWDGNAQCYCFGV